MRTAHADLKLASRREFPACAVRTLRLLASITFDISTFRRGALSAWLGRIFSTAFLNTNLASVARRSEAYSGKPVHMANDSGRQVAMRTMDIDFGEPNERYPPEYAPLLPYMGYVRWKPIWMRYRRHALPGASIHAPSGAMPTSRI